MTTLTVTQSTVYYFAPASSLVNGQDITVIEFDVSNSIFAGAIFSASQFGGSNISNSVLIQGDSAQNHIQITDIDSFSAAGWSFSNWTSTEGSGDLVVLIAGGTIGNMITGSSVNDHITGGYGGDSLYGGDGNDTFYVSPGELSDGDLMDGGNGTDKLFLAAAGSIDFRVASITGIESLSFGTSATAEAWFNSNQLGAGLISYIQGNPGTVQKLSVFGTAGPTSINLADVTFSNWGPEDVITLHAGVGDVYGSSQADIILGNHGNNALNGGLGNDSLIGSLGNDTLNGGAGDDRLEGGFPSDTTQGSYSDTTLGGLGNDVHVIDGLNDTVQENVGEGTDTLEVGFTYSGRPANFEIVQLTGTAAINLTGSTGADILRGNNATNTILGGVGADVIVGQGSKDLMTGGAGLDRMVLESLSDSGITFAQRDVINTFAHGDKIDVSAIDAKTTVAGDQAFVFVSAFTGVAGQLQWDLTNVSPTGVKGYLVQGDVNGDSNADFSLQIYTAPTQSLPGGPDAWNLASWDFIL